nr:hypothetical protein [Pseudomonas syringae pv. actinidiae]
MCSHYEAPTPHQVADAFGVALFDQGGLDLWPAYRLIPTSAHSYAILTVAPKTTNLLQRWK